MTKAGIKRTLNAAYRLEMRAYVSRMSAQRYANPVGLGAIRSGQRAARLFGKANQLRLGLELRCESEAREKAQRLKDATKEFRKTAPWNKAKRKVA
jgi:limonene-1,2-epoxide hydrolase